MGYRYLPRNLLDEGTLTSSPAMLSTLPETNLQKQERTKVARSNGIVTQVVTLVLPAAYTVTMVAHGRHNLTTAGTIRVQCFTDAAGTVAATGGDSTALAAFSTAGLAQVDIDQYLTDRFRGLKNFVWYPAQAGGVLLVRCIKITFTDAANPAGYLEIGRSFAGVFFESAYQVPQSGGVNVVPATLTVSKRSEGGSLISDKKSEYRMVKINPDRIDSAVDLANFLANARQIGKHQDFWFDMYPGDATAEAAYYRGAFKFTDLGPLEPHFNRLTKQSLTLEES